MKLVTIGGLLLAAVCAPTDGARPKLDGRAAASYAYTHVFDDSPGPGDARTALVAQAMAAGGWPLPKLTQADTLERFLDNQPGIVSREIFAGSPNEATLAAVPGDILLADWGDGNPDAPAERNRATGRAPEFAVVQGGLGKGDFVFCRHAGKEHAQMGRFLGFLRSPNFAQARYKLYHVVGNDPTHGLREGALYRDVNQLGVFVQINGGFFWARDDATVKALGGWEGLNTLPKDTIVSSNDVPVSGTMLREVNDVAVWLIEGRVRRHVRGDAGVRRLGGWEAVRTVPDGSVEAVFPHEGHTIL